MSKQWSYEEQLETLKFKGKFQELDINVDCFDSDDLWVCDLRVKEKGSIESKRIVNRHKTKKEVYDWAKQFNLKEVK
jgi:hypothetical protein